MKLAPSASILARVGAVVALSLGLSACGGGEPESEPKAKAPEAPSETERVAARVAEEFDATWRCGGCSTPQSEAVTGFAEDLDPWDGSIEVYTDLYPDTEGREFFAPQVGAAVLAVAYPLGICKVDVMASDGTRLREHESHGAGC